MALFLRGVRGATTVERDEPELILAATAELLRAMLEANALPDTDGVASILFTTTADLRSAFPAEAARRAGMVHVPLMCMQEIPVPGSLPRTVRVLLHLNTDKAQRDLRHVYLRDAARLRPDLAPS